MTTPPRFLNLATCAPILESLHVYLNGVEQYEPADWELMPPDATHAVWWIRAELAMGVMSGDLLEARYVCGPSLALSSSSVPVTNPTGTLVPSQGAACTLRDMLPYPRSYMPDNYSFTLCEVGLMGNQTRSVTVRQVVSEAALQFQQQSYNFQSTWRNEQTKCTVNGVSGIAGGQNGQTVFEFTFSGGPAVEVGFTAADYRLVQFLVYLGTNNTGPLGSQGALPRTVLEAVWLES